MKKEELYIRIGAAAGNLSKKVAPIYELLNWEWCVEGVPNEEEIFEHIVERLNDFDIEKDKFSDCGGIRIEVEDDGDNKNLKISFSLEEYVYNIQ
jgi:hypothetical protein